MENAGRKVITGDNRERVREYFQTHLCATQKECSKALGLSIMAIGRHVAAIRSEWKKDDVTRGLQDLLVDLENDTRDVKQIADRLREILREPKATLSTPGA